MTSSNATQQTSRFFMAEEQMADGRTTDVIDARSSCEAVVQLLKRQAETVTRVIRVRPAQVNHRKPQH